MKKTLLIEGMTCGHCKMKVEETLNNLKQINVAEVDLIEGSCDIEMNKEISDSELTSIISDAGYKLIIVK